MSIRSVVLLLIFNGFIIPLQAQERADPRGDAVSNFQERLAAYRTAHPSNNLFLHLDKTVYTPEETIWFKAYLLADTCQEAKVLYVRIIDEERTMIADVQFPMYDIRAHGSIELFKPGRTRRIPYKYIWDPPKALLEGNYTLYAYTDRMVSLNDTNVFVQPIRIRRAVGGMLDAEASIIDTTQLERGGKVQIKTTVRAGGTPLEGVQSEYQLLSGGKELKYGRLTTNVMGEAFVDFNYPDLPDRQSLQLKMMFTRDNDQAEMSLNLAHRGNSLTINCHPEGGVLAAGGRVSLEVLDIHGYPVSTGLLIKRGTETIDSLYTGGQGTVIWEVPDIHEVRYSVMTRDGRGKQELAIPAHRGLAGYRLKLYNDSVGCRAMVSNDGPAGRALLVLRSLDEVVWSHPMNIGQGDSVIIEVPAGDLRKDIWSLTLFDGNNQVRAERLFMNKQTDDYRLIITTEQQEYGPRKKVTVKLQAMDAGGNPVVANLSVSATEKNRVDSTLFRDIRHSHYYRAFLPDFRNRLFPAALNGDMDGLLLGRHWANNRWIDMLTTMDTPARIPYTNGTTGKVVGIKVAPHSKETNFYLPVKKKVEQIRLRGVKGFSHTKDKAELVFEERNIPVNPLDNTFFVPDSLLLSPKGLEWQMDIPRNRHRLLCEYIVEWQSPDIRFDSTVVRGNQLRLPEKFSRSARSSAPGSSLFDFQGVNRLQEVVIGKKDRSVKKRLRMTNCEYYEEVIYNDIGLPRKTGVEYVNLITGSLHPWGYTYSGGEKVVMYLGCGRYRDIHYIRNITIPEKFLLPDYELYPSTEEDSRSTIYWNPNIVTDADGTATFSFFTSETTGEFSIVAQGLAIDTLIPMMGKGEFKVTAK